MALGRSSDEKRANEEAKGQFVARTPTAAAAAG